ncbi:hypothetical protein E3O45_08090 [Cryobacterium sp. TMS1-20-1]|uniref:hypothetical protein n=1 Tax=Cryobacterium sp. TMS1-20-1 TaxID=1259223 RepID=UPI00106DA42E|nr:hypothetical protein [Cryobacterium sp. TMS1-20-1]TFC76713.1 hypothetical protein E3O45_08090 [Cryobacterium sp. TMS1-20-1]
MTHDSDPVEEPPLDIPEPPNTPTNPDQLVGPDGPAQEHAGSTDESTVAAVPVASAETGPGGPAPSDDGSAAGEAATASPVEPDNEPNLDDIDPADNPSNPDLVGHDIDGEAPNLAEPTA